MTSLSEFLHMGGYAAYVWGAYGIWLAVMTWNVVAALVRDRRVRQRLRQNILQQEQRQ